MITKTRLAVAALLILGIASSAQAGHRAPARHVSHEAGKTAYGYAKTPTVAEPFYMAVQDKGYPVE